MKQMCGIVLFLAVSCNAMEVPTVGPTNDDFCDAHIMLQGWGTTGYLEKDDVETVATCLAHIRKKVPAVANLHAQQKHDLNTLVILAKHNQDIEMLNNHFGATTFNTTSQPLPADVHPLKFPQAMDIVALTKLYQLAIGKKEKIYKTDSHPPDRTGTIILGTKEEHEDVLPFWFVQHAQLKGSSRDVFMFHVLRVMWNIVEQKLVNYEEFYQNKKQYQPPQRPVFNSSAYIIEFARIKNKQSQKTDVYDEQVSSASSSLLNLSASLISMSQLLDKKTEQNS